MTVDANPGWIRDGARVELIVIDGNGTSSVEFVGRVDGIKTRTAKGGPTTIEFRARGLAAQLIDAGFRGDVGPTVGAVVATLVEPARLIGRADCADQPLVAWIDAASTFAAVRLLAINLRAVVKTHGEHLDVVSYAAFLRRLNATPQYTVTNDDFESACVTEGLPFEGDDP